MKLTDAGILGLLNHCTKLQSLCVAAIVFQFEVERLRVLKAFSLSHSFFGSLFVAKFSQGLQY